MSKKLIPRDKGRVEHAAKQRPAKAAVKAPARTQTSARRNSGPASRSRSAKAAPPKRGIAGFFQRLLGRFRR